MYVFEEVQTFPLGEVYVSQAVGEMVCVIGDTVTVNEQVFESTPLDATNVFVVTPNGKVEPEASPVVCVTVAIKV